jgi:hypothetical protein
MKFVKCVDVNKLGQPGISLGHIYKLLEVGTSWSSDSLNYSPQQTYRIINDENQSNCWYNSYRFVDAIRELKLDRIL